MAKTQKVTKALTESKVKEMISKGLTKPWVEEQLEYYTKAASGRQGVAKSRIHNYSPGKDE